VFLAERGEGLAEGGPPRLSANERLDRMFWTFGFRGRPARPLTEVLGDLIDVSSVGGASFDLGSACFDTMCVVDGRLDAYVEPGPLLVERVPGMREEFERVGGGAVLNNSPYDLAAAALIASEAGAVVTDAAGEPYDERPLLGSGAEFQMSVAIASNRALHEQLVNEVANGLARLAAQHGDAKTRTKP
jgi:myo-inositol-1(or 4)-monophosphatase